LNLLVFCGELYTSEDSSAVYDDYNQAVQVPLLQAVVNENVRGEVTEAVSLLLGAGPILTQSVLLTVRNAQH
jgi:hypothetical protein